MAEADKRASKPAFFSDAQRLRFIVLESNPTRERAETPC